MGECMNIRIFGTVNDTIVDGPGLRFGVFVQGCSHECPGCHNPESWPADGGTMRTTDDVLAEIHENKLVRNVTLSGGDPFEQAAPCALLAETLTGEGYDVWCYTGYLFEDLQERAREDADVNRLLANINVLVDGPYVEALGSYELHWRGSSNQRLIDMRKTRAAGKIVLWEQPNYVPKKPSSW